MLRFEGVGVVVFFTPAEWQVFTLTSTLFLPQLWDGCALDSGGVALRHRPATVFVPSGNHTATARLPSLFPPGTTQPPHGLRLDSLQEGVRPCTARATGGPHRFGVTALGSHLDF